MKQSGITASKLRVILSVMVVFLIGLSAVGFYFGQSWLQTLAVSVSRTIADSKVSGGDVQSLKKIQADLLTRQGIIAKANSIMASSQDYQNQTIQDLDRYAAGTGITISNYSFAPAAAAAATPAAGTGAAAGAAPSAPATGSKSVTVTLTSPLAYTKLLKFMSAIESNLPKMQVSSVNLGRVTGSDSDSIRTEQFTIEVYTQ